MFTNEDYKNYFSELEAISKKAMVIYTDLLNEVSDSSIRSKLYPIMSEEFEAFRVLKKHKEKFL